MKNWAVDWQEKQEITSVKCARAHQWAPLCDCLTPADVSVIRTAGSECCDAWNCRRMCRIMVSS